MPFWKHAEAPAQEDLRLVVGLGNPGAQYERTRHNVGFMVTNVLASRGGGTFRSSKQRADICRVTLEGIPLLLAQPTTFMNESGAAVRRLMDYYRIPLSRVLIACDDMDIPFGTLRLRPDGSSGGNNGLKSVIASVGSQEFARLRIGVGRPHGSSIKHVLSEFPADETRMLPQLLDIAADAIMASLKDGTLSAMNRYNRNWLEELKVAE